MFRWSLPVLVLVLVSTCPCLALAGIQCDGVDDVAPTGLTDVQIFESSTNGTVSLWVKPTGSIPANNAGVQWGQALFANDGYFGLYRSQIGGIESLAGHVGASGHQRSTPVTDNTWNHLALTVGPAGFTLYKDGVIVGTTDAGATSLQFGSGGEEACHSESGNVGNLHFQGQLADIRVYKTTLTASQIEVIALGRLQTFAAEGTAYWSLDQCADGAPANAVAFLDRSGNGRSLTGNDGANNTGMLCRASENLSQPWGAF